ncbi:hypothetical protein Moror_5398 [Moniliophthora roreri MCA 2997]|uniref:Uncharacterized protein n=1 Tax=Moniliophthora roreri (strain MCA 2997) TaxID=1381753 RepID=V2WS41_MONRO|nr:hypothetical protein Moror_5398 [Moniliophthora roreri MCA 2997]
MMNSLESRISQITAASAEEIDEGEVYELVQYSCLLPAGSDVQLEEAGSSGTSNLNSNMFSAFSGSASTFGGPSSSVNLGPSTFGSTASSATPGCIDNDLWRKYWEPLVIDLTGEGYTIFSSAAKPAVNHNALSSQADSPNLPPPKQEIPASEEKISQESSVNEHPPDHNTLSTQSDSLDTETVSQESISNVACDCLPDEVSLADSGGATEKYNKHEAPLFDTDERQKGVAKADSDTPMELMDSDEESDIPPPCGCKKHKSPKKPHKHDKEPKQDQESKKPKNKETEEHKHKYVLVMSLFNKTPVRRPKQIKGGVHQVIKIDPPKKLCKRTTSCKMNGSTGSEEATNGRSNSLVMIPINLPLLRWEMGRLHIHGKLYCFISVGGCWVYYHLERYFPSYIEKFHDLVICSNKSCSSDMRTEWGDLPEDVWTQKPPPTQAIQVQIKQWEGGTYWNPIQHMSLNKFKRSDAATVQEYFRWKVFALTSEGSDGRHVEEVLGSYENIFLK